MTANQQPDHEIQPIEGRLDRTAYCAFPVSAMKPAQNIQVSEKSTKPSILPATEALPDAFFGGEDALGDDDESPNWLGDRLLPNDVPFAQMVLLDRLRRRPYHTVELEGPIDAKRLAQTYADKLYRTEVYRRKGGKASVTCLLLCLGEGVFAYLASRSLTVFAPTPQTADKAAKEFLRFVRPRRAKGKPGFHILRIEGGCIDTEFVENENLFSLTDQELKLHYGDDFLDWHKAWLDRLSKRKSGVTVLFGPAGCGKTSFLRALMARLITKSVFYYLPISEFDALSNPRFVSFWARETDRHRDKQKIVILEDAEDLLMPREPGTRANVSDLLNIGDGFLGDHLRLHVLATTNAAMQRLDAAIARPGRLVGVREFRRLSHAEAARLAQSKGLTLPQQSDYSLAEVYNAGTDTPNVNSLRHIGFL